MMVARLLPAGGALFLVLCAALVGPLGWTEHAQVLTGGAVSADSFAELKGILAIAAHFTARVFAPPLLLWSALWLGAHAIARR